MFVIVSTTMSPPHNFNTSSTKKYRRQWLPILKLMLLAFNWGPGLARYEISVLKYELMLCTNCLKMIASISILGIAKRLIGGSPNTGNFVLPYLNEDEAFTFLPPSFQICLIAELWWDQPKLCKNYEIDFVTCKKYFNRDLICALFVAFYIQHKLYFVR